MEQKEKKRKHLSPLSPEARQTAEQKRTSAVMGALKAIHSATSPDSMDPGDLERQRKGQELLGRLVAPMLGMSWEPFDLQGMPAIWATAPGTWWWPATLQAATWPLFWPCFSGMPDGFSPVGWSFSPPGPI